MADTFTELVTRTRDWLNRSTDVISDAVLQDCCRWAADDTYRTLRIPPLEETALFTGLAELTPEQPVGGLQVTSFLIPADLIEVIQIRVTDAVGKTIRVIDSKVDMRTFFNPYSERVNASTGWTRKGSRIYISTQVGTLAGAFSSSSQYVELFYYRRLPALDATFSVIPTNYDGAATYMTLSAVQTGAPTVDEGYLIITDTETGDFIVSDPAEAGAVFSSSFTAAVSAATTGDPANGVYKFDGGVPDHWMMNENEKLIIYGACAEAFSFLQEDDQSQKYLQRFTEEIQQLNDEDVRRASSGGTVQVNFNGRGLI
tara:strand:- start:5759 stop:6700 length:942 start_codon:yes stop_codon:yes gene_type:complete